MKLIIVTPHPDDETLGAGGTILKFKKSDGKIFWLNITNMKEEYGYTREAVGKRAGEIKKVASEYGFERFFDLGLKPAGLDEYPLNQIIEMITSVFADIKPEIVILPFRNDTHSDHRIVAEAVLACTKVFRHPYVKKVLMMEVPSETDFSLREDSFSPNYFVDITDFFAEKLKILGIYEGEMRESPFPRSVQNIEALAKNRGSQAGCGYAESFMMLKEIC